MKKILKGIGYVLTVLAIVFIVRKLIRMKIDFSILFGKHLPIFILCILGYAVLVYFLGKPWKRFVILITGKQVEGSEAYYICTKANLMKYIPGNVLQFVGRNEIALNHDMSHKDVACATLLDTLCMILSALTVAMVFHFNGLINWLLQYVSVIFLVLIIVAMIMAGLGILYFIYKKMPYFQFLFQKENMMAMITGTAFFWIFYLGSAMMFLAILYVITGEGFPVEKINILIGTWAIGYLMGYVMPGAPGGMGIRELVLCFLLQGIVAQESVLLATVLLRVTNIVGEVLAFLVALCIYQIRNKKEIGEKY